MFLLLFMCVRVKEEKGMYALCVGPGFYRDISSHEAISRSDWEIPREC